MHYSKNSEPTEDSLLNDAIEIIKSTGIASISLLQRKLGIGYPRAAHLMDQLVEMGIVGPDYGNGKPREILLNSNAQQVNSKDILGMVCFVCKKGKLYKGKRLLLSTDSFLQCSHCHTEYHRKSEKYLLRKIPSEFTRWKESQDKLYSKMELQQISERNSMDTKTTLQQPKTSRFSLATFVGQEAIKRELYARLQLAYRDKQALPHFLLSGADEMGKVTLARAIANEMHATCKIMRATDYSQPNGLPVTVTNLRAGDLLVIEEIEALKRSQLDFLTEAIGDFGLTLQTGEGANRRTITLKLPKFTFVGTTSKPWQVDNRLRRWLIAYEFVPYSTEEIGNIISSLAQDEGLTINADASIFLAEQCDGLPGNAAVLLKRMRTQAGAYLPRHITIEDARRILVLLGYNVNSSSITTLGERLQSMSGADFEQFVATLFRKMGYVVEGAKNTGDHGVDLIMRKENELTVVQCKRWNDAVGEPVIRDFFGSLMNMGAHNGFIVTTSSFTSQARAFAHGKPIELIDLDALLILAGKPSTS